MKDKKVFTTGEVAKICKVMPRTICKWFDSGRLRGYRQPGSNDRRIPREYLLRFLTEHGLEVPDFLREEAGPALAEVEREYELRKQLAEELRESIREECLEKARDEVSADLGEVERQSFQLIEQRNELLATLEEVLERVESLEGIDHLHGWFADARAVAEKIGRAG